MTKDSYRHCLSDLQLETNTFQEKNEIKPWLYNKLLKFKGFKIAIERSDNNKIIFKCKHKHMGLPCTFRIRANYSIKFKSWSLVIINENHNHDFTNLHLKPTRNKVINRHCSKSKTIESIVKQMDSLINVKILNKKTFDDEDKMNLIESLTLKFINNNSKYLSDNFMQQLNPKNHEKVINWCPIPLSPLLNEDEDVNNNNDDGANTSIENLIHLPGLNLNQNLMLHNSNSNNININNLINNDDTNDNTPINNHGISTSAANNYHINTITNTPNSIQNQNNQLPSFNSIQNKLPLSPTNLPTLNNTTTLNPSHLLKSYGSSSLYLNDFKNNYNFPLNNLNILGAPIKGDLKNNNSLDNNW